MHSSTQSGMCHAYISTEMVTLDVVDMLKTYSPNTIFKYEALFLFCFVFVLVLIPVSDCYHLLFDHKN